MKLLVKTNTYYLVFLLSLAPVMIAVDYYLIRYIVNEEVNEILIHERERIQFYLQQEQEIPPSSFIFNKQLVEQPAVGLNQFSDTLIFEDYANKLIPYRTHEFTVLVGTENYQISLKHVLLETNELISWLFIATCLILILLITGLYFINKKISKWAWKPFFRNLATLKNYEVNRKNPVHLESTGINEFDAFNQVVTTLMNQVEKDFQNLKEFNENISHEMQTPLAIIRNKMVLLLESQELNEKELQSVQAAYQEVNKLSKIGKSLTLISRIENQEFTRLESVDVRTVIDNIISNMEEIIRFKGLEITVNLSPVKVKCDPVLANILFTNLIKNAIQHNREDGDGYIQIQLTKERFEIKNTGKVLKTETTQLFNRFQKDSIAADSLGLGLAISQRICELYGFQLEYEYQEGEHKVSLLF